MPSHTEATKSSFGIKIIGPACADAVTTAKQAAKREKELELQAETAEIERFKRLEYRNSDN